MAFNFQIRDGLIEVTFHGKVTVDDLHQLLEILRDVESRLEVTPDRIANFSDAGVSNLRFNDVEAFAKSRQAAKLKNEIKSAIIAPTPEQYSLCRMFLAYNQNPQISIMLFEDSASAYKWIGREPKSADKPNASHEGS